MLVKSSTLLPRAVLAALVLVAACSDVTSPPSATPPRLQVANHPGFDTSIYPGDAVMQAWARGGSPYEWAGYYLPAPCHHDTSWRGKRSLLSSLGWGAAVIYVGQQTWDGAAQIDAPAPRFLGSSVLPSAATLPPGVATSAACSRTLLSAGQGDSDGLDAVTAASAEGFADGTVVYLDLEHMDSLPASMRSYYESWIARVLADGRYRAGIYAHRANAAQVYADARSVYATTGHVGGPEMWVAGGPGFSLRSAPADVGFTFASIWQGALDVTRTYSGSTVVLDESVSRNWSPSMPLTPTNP